MIAISPIPDTSFVKALYPEVRPTYSRVNQKTRTVLAALGPNNVVRRACEALLAIDRTRFVSTCAAWKFKSLRALQERGLARLSPPPTPPTTAARL